MGDTDALRDKIAQAIEGHCIDVHKSGLIHTALINGADAQRLADAVLPVVTQQTAQALSLLRSRVEALVDELDDEVQTITNRDAGALGRRGALRDAARRLRRSLSDNKEQQ